MLIKLAEVTHRQIKINKTVAIRNYLGIKKLIIIEKTDQIVIQIYKILDLNVSPKKTASMK